MTNKTKQNKTFTIKCKQLFRKTILLLGMGLFISSCQNEGIENNSLPINNEQGKPEISFESVNFNENGELKLKFAEAISKALIANKDLRRLVKEEALKKFDKDYDVLYFSVKNKSLTPTEYLEKSNQKTSKNLLQKSANALTFREAILPFFNSEAELIEIEQKIPLLTIFVPELPLESFSAATWDVNDETQIPDVAMRLNNTNDVPVIGKDGSKYVIEAELTPGFPIVVIKENERVRIVSHKSKSKQNYKTAIVDENVEFIDDNFDPNASTNTTPPIANANTLDQFLIDSYNVWQGYGPGGWQRDNIYYGLTPSNTRGAGNYNFKEYITSFRMTGDPKQAFDLISKNSVPGEIDPTQVLDYRLGHSSGWTDGAFEILVKVYFGSQSSTEGLFLSKGIDVKPSDLFELKYTSHRRGKWPFYKTFITTEIVATKKLNLLDPAFDSKIEMVTWDLSNYSNRWKFAFEEVDATVNNSYSEKLSSKYNVNFEVNAATGVTDKVGLKFGASQEQTKENTYVFSYVTTGPNLYESVVPFFDNAINKDPLTGQFKYSTYSTGRVEFEIRPIRTQW